MKTAMEMLKVLDEWGGEAPAAEVQGMWHILTALRGCDKPDDGLKYNTTAVIRALTLPRMASRCGATINKGTTAKDITSGGGTTHFESHIRHAKDFLIKCQVCSDYVPKVEPPKPVPVTWATLGMPEIKVPKMVV